LSEGLRVHKAI